MKRQMMKTMTVLLTALLPLMLACSANDEGNDVEVKGKDVNPVGKLEVPVTPGTVELTNNQRQMVAQGNDDTFRLTDEEWQTLTADVDQAFDGYVSRLQQLARLSELELRVCCLVKMGIEPSRIATLLCKSRSDISATRSRLYRKIHGTKGTSAQMDDFLHSF